MPHPSLAAGDGLANFADKLVRWHSMERRAIESRRLDALLYFTGEEIARVRSGDWRRSTVAAKQRLETALADGAYGHWRAQNGNASYEAYVAYIAGELKGPGYLSTVQWALADLESLVDFYVRKFRSIKKLARIIDESSSVIPGLIGRLEPAAVVRTPSLGIADVSLCLAWANADPIISTCGQGLARLTKRLSTYETCRLLSARSAELVAAKYYKGLGLAVEDVSKAQLDVASESWAYMDLIAGGCALDVKNARRSFSSPEYYVGHCVPAFKQDRKSRNDVSVVGVLSEYIADIEQLMSGGAECLVLGEVNITEIRRLFVWMRRRFGGLMNLDGLWNRGHLPGWLFEYPASLYSSRNMAVEQARVIVERCSAAQLAPFSEVPGWLLTLGADKAFIDSLAIEVAVRKVLNDLVSLRDEVGLKRASLYVYTTGIVAEALSNGQAVREVIGNIEQCLFSTEDATRPLGLLDPQGQIWQLISIMSRVADRLRQDRLQLMAFRMPHPSILRGMDQQGRWVTLLSFCGGWRHGSGGGVRCGAYPLFFGQNATCSDCGHLICEECGFCSNDCTR